MASVPSFATAYNNTTIRAFNLQGILIGEFKNEAEAFSSLREGIYILNGRKIKIE